MTVDRNKINSFALMYGNNKTTKEQLQEALETLASQARCFLNRIDSPALYTSESANYRDAYQMLNDSLNTKSNVKVVYEYKLKRADGKYLNRSSWDEKGKTYKNKAALMSALGTYISECAERDPNKPRFEYHSMPRVGDAEAYQEYREAYKEWRNKVEDRNYRASYIPKDWIVIAIAVNTAQEPKEMDARTWYSKLKKPEDA